MNEQDDSLPRFIVVSRPLWEPQIWEVLGESKKPGHVRVRRWRTHDRDWAEAMAFPIHEIVRLIQREATEQDLRRFNVCRGGRMQPRFVRVR